jgi:gluconokinase
MTELESPYVLSLDIGTSSVRAGLFDRGGRGVPGVETHLAHAPETTPDGGVEMDPDGLVEAACWVLSTALAQSGPRASEIAGVAVSTFWHSILGVDAADRPTTPVMMWADTRSVREVEFLRQKLDEAAVHARTGCPFHTSYVPPKLLWLHRERAEAFGRTQRWLSPGEYLFLRLFGTPRCSVSMASGTGMLNQRAMDWDDELLHILPIDRQQLSPVEELTPSRGLRPEFAHRLPGLAEAAWIPAVGDGACSNIGSGCTGPERAALMVGTSGAMRVVCPVASTAGEPLAPPGLWCYRIDAARPLIGGALSNGGNLFAWLHDTLRLPDSSEVEAALAAMSPDAHGLTVLPFLAGERSPGWIASARAAFTGISWSTHPLDILRAGLESVAYRFAQIAERLPLRADTQIVATGGALLPSPAWTQIVCDALGRPLIASEEPEASSHGAALLALETLGLLAHLAQAPFAFGRVFQPDMERHRVYEAARRRQAILYDRIIRQPLLPD